MNRISIRSSRHLLAAFACLGLLVAGKLSAQPLPFQLPGQAGGPNLATISRDLNTSITLSLNNINIDQLVRFLSDTTGKPVIKQRNIQTQITVTSPVQVSKREAIRLISVALKMDNILLLETDDDIQIIPSNIPSNIPYRPLGDLEDLDAMPDSLEVIQRTYHLKNISAQNLRTHLQKFVPDSSMTIDNATNTVVLTDQIARLKRYDRIIKSLDTPEAGDRTIEIFQLKHSDAAELAQLLASVLIDTDSNQQAVRPDPRQFAANQGNQGNPNQQRGGPNRGRQTSTPVQAGNVTIVPDTRLNRLIVSAPKARIPDVARLIEDFDRPEDMDVRARPIPIRFTEPTAVAQMVNTLFRQTQTGPFKDAINAVASDDGQSVLVMSSASNFAVLQDLVKELDTPDAGKRETHTYTVNHISAQDLATQLQNLFDQQNQTRIGGGGGGGAVLFNAQTTGTKPSFVASPRTNSLMVLARPKDFIFIEQMIKELDVEVDPAAFSPRIYRIRYTDANELLKVLQTLFQGTTSSTGNRQQQDQFFRQTGNSSSTDVLQAAFGQIRFVVDNVTNTIVALSSNRKNYEILDATIAKLDQLDPESTQLLIVDLRYATAAQVADQLNNLFSEGSVSRSTTGGTTTQSRSTTTDSSGDASTSTASNPTSSQNFQAQLTAQSQSSFPWQSGTGSRTTGTGSGTTAERPISTLIGQVRAVPDTRSNKLLIAAPTIYFPALRSLVESLDQQEPQVHISARILEITRGNEKRVGLRWTPDPNTIDPAELENALLGVGQLGYIQSFGRSNLGSTNTNSTTGTGSSARTTTTSNPIGNQVVTNSALNGITQQVTTTTGAGNAVLGANVNMALLVQLLVKNSIAEIIDEPKITVNNNEMAEIFVGSQIPFRVDTQVTDTGGVTFGTEYRDVGIKLDVTPHINRKGEVVLAADLENSAVVPGELIDGQVVTDKTSMHTALAVESNQTMVIGGVRIGSKNAIKRHVPYLGNIPVINWFFKKTDRTASIRELAVFITPQVLDSRQDDDALLERVNEALKETQNMEKGPELPIDPGLMDRAKKMLNPKESSDGKLH